MLDLVNLKIDRLDHSRRSIALPLLLLSVVAALYVTLCAAIIASPTWLALLLGLPCGLLIGDLFVIGHDACHKSFTSSSRLNSFIGRICFLPSYHSYSLWDHGHNRIHHKYNNIKGMDYVWEPMSPTEFEAASPLNRLRYKFFRSFVGMPFYYLIEILLPKMIVPRSSVVGEINKRHCMDSALVLCFAVLQIFVVSIAAQSIGSDVVKALLFAVLIPFIVYNILMSAVIYVHHTHPDVGWYRTISEWREKNGAILGTVHVRFPLVLRVAMLEITEHNAHHYAPGVPLYNLHQMQSKFEARSDEVVTWKFGFLQLLNILRQCKVYNFENGRWERFPPAAPRC